MIDKVLGAVISTGQAIVGVLSWLGRILLKSGYWVLVVGIPLGMLWYFTGVVSLYWQFSYSDDYRGAVSIEADSVDDSIAREQIRYLPQNWDEGESLWFYNITQGSNLLPYDFFMALEQKDSNENFRSNVNINKYRYLPQGVTGNNRDALPVGMVKDSYQGKEYMGFSCAACHTSQINYKGIGIRIDGGPGAGDMESFLIDMVAALEAINTPIDDKSAKSERFYKAVLARNTYENEAQIKVDLVTYIKQLKTYALINEPVWPDNYKTDIKHNRVTHYGYGRLDAFGRIYNRVLQHLMDIDTIEEILKAELPVEIYSAIKGGLTEIKTSSDHTDIVVRVLEVLEPELNKLESSERIAILTSLRSKMYNPANAPVSYPYLWDIAQHDYVQWTGLVSNGGLGPLGRNVGQVIGVFGTLDWQKKSKFTISSRLGGQGGGKNSLDFKSSINKINLRRVENQLRTLQSPRWPEEYLPAIDKKLRDDGAEIFGKYCISCHKNIKRDDPGRRVITHISKQEAVGTDPVLAENTIAYTGNSGMVRGQYVEGSLGNLSIEEKMPVASLVKISSKRVVLEPDPDRLIGFRMIEWAWGILKSLKDNPVKETAKQGNYDLPSPQRPFAPLNGYKARSLNGIWATAPYLHNGSVPNLHELLLPKKRASDPVLNEDGENIEYRSDRFMVGSRKFDPERVGFESKNYSKFEYDTRKRGNSNAGHQYAAGRTAQPSGEKLPALTRAKRLALLEYLKSL